MNETLFSNLSYFAQISLFAGISLIIFAWFEKKDVLEKLGQFLFIILGIVAAWVVFSGQIAVPEMIDGQVPKEARMLTFFYGLVGTGILGAIALTLKMMKKKSARWLNALMVVGAIALFFMVYNLMKA